LLSYSPSKEGENKKSLKSFNSSEEKKSNSSFISKVCSKSNEKDLLSCDETTIGF
jgi:hypothetical protein